MQQAKGRTVSLPDSAGYFCMHFPGFRIFKKLYRKQVTARFCTVTAAKQHNFLFHGSSVRSDPDRCQATSAEHPGSSHPSISTDDRRWILPASSRSQALSYIPMLSYFPRTGNPPYRTSCRVWESVFRRS